MWKLKLKGFILENLSGRVLHNRVIHKVSTQIDMSHILTLFM